MFQIISDGGCDFSKEEAQNHKIGIVPFYISFDDSTYLKEGIDIHKEEYFKRLLSDKNLFPKTSQPNPQDYLDAFTPHLEEGRDILCLTISSKLSGSYNSAVIAKDMAKDEYPDRQVVLVDSLNGCVAQGLILRQITRMRDSGLSLSEVQELCQRLIKTTKVYFTLDSVEYLKKGGRIGPTTALVGGLLGLKPILHLVDGEVQQLDSVRGKKNVLKKIEEGLVEALQGNADDIMLSIGHILSYEDALALKAGVETALGIKIGTPITEVGATIGTHAGPGALAFAYCKMYEKL